MKKHTLFIVMLTAMLGFAFGAEKGAISLLIPSAMAGDSKDSKNKDSKDSKDSKDKDSKDKDSKDKDSKDKGSKDKGSKDKDSKDTASKDSGSNGSGNGSGGSCTCPPGISSCICADGSTGNPGPGSLPSAPASLRSVHGG